MLAWYPIACLLSGGIDQSIYPHCGARQGNPIYLVEDGIPGESSVVDDDVNFPFTESSSLCNKPLQVFCIQDVALYRQSASTVGIDLFGNCVRLCCKPVSFEDGSVRAQSTY